MTAKPVAARVAALRQRRATLGLTRLEVYVHPDDHAKVKTLVAKLCKARAGREEKDMTDRELLEDAYAAYRPGENYTRLVNDAGSDYWNPLTDDGDALRLAVKLGMTIEQWSEGHVYVGHRHPGNFEHEKHGTDPLAATRRAIVRAAAEIGRSMK